MTLMRLVVAMAVVTVIDAAEPEVPPTVVPGPGADAVAVSDPAGLSDFIIPIASDLRFGYSANIGSYHRSQDEGEGTDSSFIEHGLWTSYVVALSGPGRALSGKAEWRAEVGLLISQAEVSNPNGSTGTLRTAGLDLGIGPAWRISETDASRLEIEVMPFVGVALSSYENRYTSEDNGLEGATSIDATGLGVEYGIKANIMWCWSSGWGAALHVGVVQRVSSLDGDSTTRWDNSSVTSSDYLSDDTLTGVRFGLFVARRF